MSVHKLIKRQENRRRAVKAILRNPKAKHLKKRMAQRQIDHIASVLSMWSICLKAAWILGFAYASLTLKWYNYR